MSLQVCTQGSVEGLSTLSTECLHVVFYCWQLKLNHSSPVIRQLRSLKFRLQSPDCRPMLMLVPSAKHLDLYAAPPQSRLVLFQIKPPLLSISTPTLSPAWSFVSLSLKTPPVELPPPPPKKKKLPYVGHLPMRRLLPGQAVRRLSAAAAQGALCSHYKSCPQEALPADTKRGFIQDNPACAAAAPGWSGDKPLAAARRQSWQPGVSAGCEMDGTSIKTRAFFGSRGKCPGRAIVLSDLPFLLS